MLKRRAAGSLNETCASGSEYLLERPGRARGTYMGGPGYPAKIGRATAG